MKTRAAGLLVFSAVVIALPGCLNEPSCPYGEVLVRDSNYRGDVVCVRRSYSSTPAGTATTPAATTDPPPAAPASGTGDGTPTPAAGTTLPPAVGGTCGGGVASSGSVRVVDKNDQQPTLGEGALNLTDGTYSLVQATFFRTGQSASPVRSLKAALEVRGPTLTLNATDMSVAGLPDESLTFLMPSAGLMTKTCEAVHGSVSAWFFPFNVGSATQPQLAFDGQAGFVRFIVNRADGATELVFAR